MRSAAEPSCLGTSQRPLRVSLLVLGMGALLAGLWAGLLRLGWPVPLPQPLLPAAHGPLMVSGFLGTLISLERAVALGRRWAYSVPGVTGCGALVLICGLPGSVGPWLLTLGSLGLVGLFAVILWRQTSFATGLMGLGALIWLGGNGLWLAGWPIASAVLWWAGFPVLTIAGERLELNRLLRLSPRSHLLFVVALTLLLAGLVVASITFDAGMRLAGSGLLALATWLLHYDIARRTVRQAGLTRFIALSLLSGYVWLGASGLLAIVYGGVMVGPRYDAILHALFVGFVLAMIFGHAPVIFAAVLEFAVPFRGAFYAHLALLHVSLALRIVGDLGPWWPGRYWGGLLNVLTVLFFLSNTARAIWQGRRRAS